MAKIYPVAGEYDRNEWCTPKKVVEAVRAALGGSIDLDPTSSVYAQQTIQAVHYFTKDSPYSKTGWFIEKPVTVFMNPPYAAKDIVMAVEYFLCLWAVGLVSAGIVLTNNSTETAWAQSLLAKATAICFPARRIQFGHPQSEARVKNSNRQGQLFFYFGGNFRLFEKTFCSFGKVARLA